MSEWVSGWVSEWVSEWKECDGEWVKEWDGECVSEWTSDMASEWKEWVSERVIWRVSEKSECMWRRDWPERVNKWLNE